VGKKRRGKKGRGGERRWKGERNKQRNCVRRKSVCEGSNVCGYIYTHNICILYYYYFI
jgi:hypothetical protein